GLLDERLEIVKGGMAPGEVADDEGPLLAKSFDAEGGTGMRGNGGVGTQAEDIAIALRTRNAKRLALQERDGLQFPDQRQGGEANTAVQRADHEIDRIFLDQLAVFARADRNGRRRVFKNIFDLPAGNPALLVDQVDRGPQGAVEGVARIAEKTGHVGEMADGQAAFGLRKGGRADEWGRKCGSARCGDELTTGYSGIRTLLHLGFLLRTIMPLAELSS